MSKKSNLKITDHSVSGEEFELRYIDEFDMYETWPQPSEEELPRYYNSENYISHTDGKRNTFEKLYHIIKGFALKNKIRLLNQLAPQKGRLLDFGCGTGDFLNEAYKNRWTVSGIEPNSEARHIANQKTKNCVFDDNEVTKLTSDNFDVITLWHVLEHLPELDAKFELFKDLLKIDGALIIAVPNFKSFDAHVYAENWAAYDVPRHLWHFSRNSIKLLADKNGMEIVNCIPMKFDAYYVSMLSEKYAKSKFNFLKGLWMGLCSNLKAKRSGEYSSLIYVLKKVKNRNKGI